MDEIVDLTRRDSEEESKEQMPMEVKNDCKSDGNENDRVEENWTEIEREQDLVPIFQIPMVETMTYQMPSIVKFKQMRNRSC